MDFADYLEVIEWPYLAGFAGATGLAPSAAIAESFAAFAAATEVENALFAALFASAVDAAFTAASRVALAESIADLYVARAASAEAR